MKENKDLINELREVCGYDDDEVEGLLSSHYRYLRDVKVSVYDPTIHLMAKINKLIEDAKA